MIIAKSLRSIFHSMVLKIIMKLSLLCDVYQVTFIKVGNY